MKTLEQLKAEAFDLIKAITQSNESLKVIQQQIATQEEQEKTQGKKNKVE